MFERTLQSVSPDTMGKIVRTYATLIVYMITDVTGLQDNATQGVNPDGQETDVISVRLKFYFSFFLLKRLIRISKIFLQINAIMHNLNRSQFSVYFLQTFFKHYSKKLIDFTCIVVLF